MGSHRFTTIEEKQKEKTIDNTGRNNHNTNSFESLNQLPEV